jgi:ParB family chromosome partitioning protein
LEEAEGFQELLNMKDSHWTQEQIGKMVGKPQSRISESIRLLNLPEEIQANIRQRILTREHGIELLRIDNANSQKGMANKIVKGGWSVKQTREAIDKQLKGSSGSEAPQSNGQEAPASSATFKRKDGAIVISARFPGQFDLETVMSDLRSKLTPWLEKNPAPKE